LRPKKPSEEAQREQLKVVVDLYSHVEHDPGPEPLQQVAAHYGDDRHQDIDPQQREEKRPQAWQVLGHEHIVNEVLSDDGRQQIEHREGQSEQKASDGQSLVGFEVAQEPDE